MKNQDTELGGDGQVIDADMDSENFEDMGGVECCGGLPEVFGDSRVEICRRAMVYDGCGYREVSKRHGVSVSQLKRWSVRGGWELERQLVQSGAGAKIGEEMVRFANARELGLASGYYDLQEAALSRLREILTGEVSASDVRLILEVADKGLSLGERVMGRANPKRARALREALEGEIGVGGGVRGSGVQVNVLAGAVRAAQDITGVVE